MPDLGKFSGLEQIRTQAEILKKAMGDLSKILPDLKSGLDGVKNSAASALSEVAKLNAELERTDSHASALAGVQGLSFGELISPERLVEGKGGDIAARDAAANAPLAAALKDISDRLVKLTGDSNNYWAQLFEKEIPYLTSGARSAAEAQSMLQQILNAYLPGMLNELLQNPNMPAEMRRMLEELVYLAQSGNFTLKQVQDAMKAVGKKLDQVGEHVDQVKDLTSGLANIGDELQRFTFLSGSST